MLGTITPTPRGLDGVVATTTRLSHVDGVAGELIIGGYELKELAGRVGFEEAAHLLWRGVLPTSEELTAFRRGWAARRALPEATMRVVRAAAKAPPVDSLRMACATLSLDLARPDDISASADREAATNLAARFPTLVAAHARIAEGKVPIDPREDLSQAENFLYMLHDKEPDPDAARALDAYWVTVIEHGMNASTFAARVIASTRSDMVSAVTGAIGALKGPLHGGAPGPVGSARLENRSLYELARAVEETALKVLDEVKPGRNLQTNVEFYTALVLQSLGLAPPSFVAVFACGRVADWCAHVIEQHAEDHLIRPQSLYVGPRGSALDR